jgi:hypothetical protein
MVNTGNWVEPLGVPSLENAVEPPNASKRSLPDVTYHQIKKTTFET